LSARRQTALRFLDPGAAALGAAAQQSRVILPPGRKLPKKLPRRRSEETAEPIVDLLNRGVSAAGIAAREADGKTESPRKWRRNGLKRLNPRPEMVWARKPRTYNIWYTGARLTVRLRYYDDTPSFT